MTILSQMQTFSQSFGKTISVNSKTWRYYRLGQVSPILWLTGGLRHAVEVIIMGKIGHTAALRDPAVYIELLEQAMS